MADDIVPLGFDVDTSGLAKAKADAASAGTEISKLGNVLDKLSAGVNQLNTQLKANTQATGAQSTATKAAGDSAKQATGELNTMLAALKPLDDSTRKMAADLAAMVAAMKPLDAASKQTAADLRALLDVQNQALSISQKHLAATGTLSQQFASFEKAVLSLASAHSSAAAATKRSADAASESASKFGIAQGVIGKVSGTVRELAGVLGVEAGGGGGGRSLNSALGLAGEGFEALEGTGAGAAAVLGGIGVAAAAAGAAFVGMQAGLAHYQDEMSMLNARLKLATGSQAEANAIFGDLVKTADAAGISVESFADTFTRFDRIREEIGATNDEVLKFTRTLVQLSKEGGATPYQTERGLMDLTMGLAQGNIDGRVLREIVHETPTIGQAIERGNGWTPGSIQSHERNGDVTAQAVFSGILNGADDANAKFKELPTTVDMAFTRLKNDAAVAAAELGKVTGATTMIQAGINDLDAGVQRLSSSLKSDNSVKSLTAQINELKAAEKADPGAGMVSVQRLAQIKQLTAELEKATAAQSTLNNANAKDKLYGKGDAEVNAALNTIADKDPYTKKLGELTKELGQAQKALDDMNKGFTSFKDEPTWEANVTKLTDAIARIKKEMEDAAPAAQKMQQAIDDATADRGTYGIADAKIAASARKLNDDQTAKGLPPLPPGMADNLFTQQQIGDTIDRKSKATLSAELELQRMGGIGAGPARRAQIDSSVDAENWRTETFGTGPAAHTDEANQAVKNYRDSLLAVKQAQNEVNDATARFNSLNAYRSAAAGLAVASQGSYAVSLAQQQMQRRTRNASNPGTGDIEFNTWQAQEQTRVREQLADALRQQKELQDEIASAGNPNSLQAVRSQFAADQIRRTTAPGVDQNALVAATMNKPQLEQNEKLAEQTAEMQRQLDLETQKAEIVKNGGADMDVQLAVLQKKFELEQEGVQPSNEYYQTQIKITAELAKQTQQMNQQKQLGVDLQKSFGDVVKVIGTDLMKTFDTIITTSGSKTKALLNGISSLAQDVANTIIQDDIIKPFEALASQYGEGLLKQFIDLMGGSAGSLSSLGSGTSAGMDVSSYSSGLGTANLSYGFTANAKGGAYDSPSLSAYSGQVLNKPTFFAFASGGGVAGEAGPEGILPLKRGADGSLGVRAYGGGQPADTGPNITIVDQRTAQGSQPVQTSGGTDSSGKKFIQVLIRDTVKAGMNSGEYDASMKNNFQATRPLTKR
jgi:tape measure domain-containing protein